MKQRQPGLLGQAYDQASEWLGLGEQSRAPSNASVQQDMVEDASQEEEGGGLLDYLFGGSDGGAAQAAPPPTDAGDEAGGVPSSSAGRTYIVQKGDTVGNIALRGTGDTSGYKELNVHNLRSPDDGALEPGDELRIPPGWDLAALGTEPSPEAQTLVPGGDQPEQAGPAEDEEAGAASGAWGLMEGLLQTGERAVGRLEEALGGQSASDVAVANGVARANQAAVEANALATNSAKVRRQAALRRLFEEYTQMEVEVPIGGELTTVTVRARYRIFRADHEGESAYDRANSLSASGASDAESMAKIGKASPDQLRQAIEEAAQRGPLGSVLKDVSSVEAAEEAINSYTHKELGVDCSGFVWRALQSMDETSLAANTIFGKQCGTGIAETRLGASKDPDEFLKTGADISEQPELWNTGDVLIQEERGGDGHFVIIYDCGPTRDAGVYLVEVMHSKGSEGVVMEKWTFGLAQSPRWQRKNGSRPMPDDTLVKRASGLDGGEALNG